MFSLVSGKPASLTFEQGTSFNHYHYKIVQRPGVLVSGQPATFTVTVMNSQTGQAVAGQKFTAGVNHSSGILIDSHSSDWSSTTYVSDANGTFIVPYTSHFFGLIPDNGFGFFAEPVFTPQEQAAYDAVQSETLPDSGIGTDNTIYPKWLGWFGVK